MIKGMLNRLMLVTLAACALIVSSASAQDQDLQAELTTLAHAGGGTYRLPAGARVSVGEGVVVPSHVTLDLNGGELVTILTRADAAGVRLMSDATLRNGTVTVVSRGSPGTQSGAHAPVLVGALMGDNAAVDRVSPLESPSGWVVSGVTVRSDKRVAVGDGIVAGSAGIQVMGGAHNGLIENIVVPDSDILLGGVMLDWNTVGPILSADVSGSAAAYRRGAGYTTHPHDIVIRNIRVGRLTRPSIAATGSFGVRLSGVHDVTVSGVTVESITEAGVFHTAGDLGYEFARPADRARAHRGIRIDGVSVTAAEGGYLLRSDTYADNIARAAEQGYRPMLPPIATTDMIVSNVSGAAGRKVGDGFRLDHQRGGRFSNIEARGFRRGIYVDEQVYDVTIENPVAIDSREAGVDVGHPYRPPANVRIVRPRALGAGAASEMRIGRSDGVLVSAATGRVRIDSSAVRALVSD